MIVVLCLIFIRFLNVESRDYKESRDHKENKVLKVNMDKWNKLSDTQKAQIESACGDNIKNGIAEGEAIQIDALNTLKEKGANRWTR